MTAKRADLGFGAALGDLEEFVPRAQKPPKVDTTQAAEAAGFRSREAKAPQGSQQMRRRRTGRNTQFNLKVKPETIEDFCGIADDNGWGLGETLERAVVLLQREYGNNSGVGG